VTDYSVLYIFVTNKCRINDEFKQLTY